MRVLRSQLSRILPFVAWSAAFALGPARADGYLSMLSVLTGQEIGRAYRTDGKYPTRAHNIIDQKACIDDPREVSKTDVDRINELMETNKEAVSIELAKVIGWCMTKKGWRIVITGADVPGIEPSVLAALDAVLERLSSSLPNQVDQHTDLVQARRYGTDVIYTMKVRAQSQGVVDKLRRFIATDPHAVEAMNKNLMKKEYCTTPSNIFLTAGVVIIWEVFDERGLECTPWMRQQNCRQRVHRIAWCRWAFGSSGGLGVAGAEPPSRAASATPGSLFARCQASN